MTTVAVAAAIAGACSAGGGSGSRRRCPNRTYDDGTDTLRSRCCHCCSEAIANEDDVVAIDGEVAAAPAYPCCQGSHRIRVHPCVSIHFHQLR